MQKNDWRKLCPAAERYETLFIEACESLHGTQGIEDGLEHIQGSMTAVVNTSDWPDLVIARLLQDLKENDWLPNQKSSFKNHGKAQLSSHAYPMEHTSLTSTQQPHITIFCLIFSLL